jgi:FeS assembly SUF system regulator
MIKLSKMTDYAVVCLGTLARRPGYSMSATELSKETGLALYTVQKLLKLLVSKSDFIKAYRGALGGYILNRNSSNISVVEIIEALDGPITLTSCVNKSESFCEASDICFLGGKWNKINEIIRNSLNDITLEDLLNYENPFLIDDNKDTLVDRIN